MVRFFGTQFVEYVLLSSSDAVYRLFTGNDKIGSAAPRLVYHHMLLLRRLDIEFLLPILLDAQRLFS